MVRKGSIQAFGLRLAAIMLTVVALLGLATPATAQDKPNILVIWGDDLPRPM